jgi:cbb3-type cytochrome oxidase subunit 3
MLKFAKNYMESIEGIATYPIISLVIFFVFFICLFYWVATASKAHIKEMAELPLEQQPIKTKRS